eukprot:6241251-Pyramimonas_sp.AAC.1
MGLGRKRRHDFRSKPILQQTLRNDKIVPDRVVARTSPARAFALVVDQVPLQLGDDARAHQL